MAPFDCYKTYLALKQHFCKETYDYHKYCGKSRASLQSFYNRKDRYWFEKLSRQKSDREILDYFVANFVSCDDPDRMWIGEIIKNGESNYVSWRKRTQSLSYTFVEESEKILDIKNFDKTFLIENKRHPQIVKEYLKSSVSLETLMVYDEILHFSKEYDKILDDPVWSSISRKMKKYKSFINIDASRYMQILKDSVLGGK